MTATDTRVAEAIAAGDRGMEAATDHADARRVVMIDKAIEDANASGEVWSANTIRDRLPVACSGLVGARIKAASMRSPRQMVAVGRERSTLLSTHGAWICQWTGADQ